MTLVTEENNFKCSRNNDFSTYKKPNVYPKQFQQVVPQWSVPHQNRQWNVLPSSIIEDTTSEPTTEF